MTKFKLALKIFGGLIAIILLLALLVPVLYKKEILHAIKNQVNSSINGKLDFADLELSLFTHFPKLTVQIDELQLLSYVEQDTTTLLQSIQLDLELNLWNVISKSDKLDIVGFFLKEPKVHIKNYTDSISNYQVIKVSEPSESSNKQTQLMVEEYGIANGYIVMEDLNGGMTIKSLNHSGQIDIGANTYEISTQTSIDSLSYTQSGIKYLSNARLNSKLKFTYSGNEKKLTLQKNELELNDLKLSLEGSVARPDTNTLDLDIVLKSPGNSFKEIFSLIPKAYTKDYKNVISKGSFSLNVKVAGRLNAVQGKFPSWDAACIVEDGSIQYQGMPVSLNDVNVHLKSTNSSDDLSNALINISKFGFSINNNPVSGNMFIDQLRNNPHVKAMLNGKIDLDNMKKFIPLDPGVELSGILDLSCNTEFYQQDVEKSELEKLKLEGYLSINRLIYKDPKQPRVTIETAEVSLNASEANIKKFNLKFGKSDLNLIGTISNPLSITNEKLSIVGNLQFTGNLIDANEWLTKPDEPAPIGEPSSIPGLAERAAIKLSANINKIYYEDYKISNVKAQGTLQKDQLTLAPFEMSLNENDLSGSVKLTSITQYIFNNKTLGGNINVHSNQFDANKILVTDAAASKEETPTEPFLVPEGMDISINFDCKNLKYDKMQLQDIKAAINVKEDEMQFKELSSNAMGGQMNLSGIYNSANPSKPIFDMKYDMKKLQFPKIFESVKTFAVIAPIAKFIEGKFNSSFVFSGALDKNMMPDLSTINAGGIIETIDAAIKNYKPLEAISNKLNLKELKDLSLKNTKNWFAVENGQVSIKELKYKINDIDVDINGYSKIQGPMEYGFKFRIPRNKIKQNVIGQAAETGFDFIKGLGAKAGVKIEEGSHVNILVEMTGKLLDPKLKFKLLGSDGESLEDNGKGMVNQAVDKAKDSIARRAESELEKAKQKGMAEAQKLEDSLRKEANKKIESEKNKILDKAAEEAKKKIDSNLVNKGKEIIKDKMGNGAGDILKDSSVNKIKDKIKDWNPFKK